MHANADIIGGSTRYISGKTLYINQIFLEERKMSKRLLSLLLVLAMLVLCLAACGGNNNDSTDGNSGNGGTTTACPGCNSTSATHEKCAECGEYTCVGDHTACNIVCSGCEEHGVSHGKCQYCDGYLCVGDHTMCDLVVDTGSYVYKDSVTTLAGNWNPHTYQVSDDNYPLSFITTGLYGFVFNDALHAVEGKEDYSGYTIIPEMAADFPVDVTEAIKAAHPEYHIPESATAGYAYTIKLNPNATWQNGEKITAETYVESMKRLLDPNYGNYRASDYFAGSFSIANAINYCYQGDSSYNVLEYTVEELVKNDDGTYSTKAGNPVYIAVTAGCDYLDGYSLNTYVTYYPEYFDLTDWENLVAATDAETGYAPLTDDTLSYLITTIAGNPAWGEDETYAPEYMVEHVVYEDNFSFDNVGLFASDEYEITLVLSKSLTGFNLLYSLSGNWIVYLPYYDELMQPIEGTDAYSTTYNTSLETTMSYGPYKMTSFVRDNSMTFEKNENWFGYTDGQHTYIHAKTGEHYSMYQTTRIECKVVTESETRKLMFLKGELMGYGLQAEDFEEYRDSDYCYATPSETIFFFVFNGNMEAIQTRETNDDFDQTKYDLETMTLNSFRRAIAVTFDKEAFASTISPSRSGGYGLIGNSYLYDPETGARYRDTDQAKLALCEFYSVDISKYDSLDEAVASITGYDVDTAKSYFNQAYTEALEAGYITDSDSDGICDQDIKITYASSTAGTEFIIKTLDYLNEKLAEVLVGTPFEGKIYFEESASLGNEWSDLLKAGMVDTCLCGWSGSALDPFGLTDLYTNPSHQYDAAWFDSEAVELTLEVNVAKIGEEADVKELTMNLRKWSDALNGETVTVDGVEYCFGYGVAEVETRLDILAAIETQILSTYNYIPMLQDAGMSLLSQQVFYVVDEYNPVMGRGGIAYLRYNYDETAWAEYVAAQGGELQY